MGTDTGIVHGGAHSASLRSVATPGAPGQFASFYQAVRADSYRGKRVRLRGWVRTVGVQGDGAGLWLRVDGLGTGLVFDDSRTRRVAGTSDWSPFQVVVDVPQAADGLAFGGVMGGSGQSWYDDLTLEVVGTDVPTTPASSSPGSGDSAAVANTKGVYVRAPSAPVDLDFEGAAAAVALDAGAVAWLQSAAVPLATVNPDADLGDLTPLGAMVGDAHLVAFGEATHGTREFFQIKHRALEYLVKQKGFTAFAIEATWPEANALDLYVRTGQGDPAVLLSNLYFWTWNTQEVLDMIAWMRAYNAGVTPDKQVRFFGFDMQSPGAAIDSASAFVRRADPGQAAAVDSAYACLALYRNNGPRVSKLDYAQATAAARAACAAAVARPYAVIAGAQGAYTAATSAGEYARALQSARLVVQWESYAGGGSANATRDRYMAENVGWLMGQLPAGSRMMLWAHDLHVSRIPTWMGANLAARYGGDYVNVGFAFGTGTFNALPATASGLTTGPSAPQASAGVAPGSFEAYAAAAGGARFLLDARRIPGAAAAAPLAGPLGMRMIGSVYVPGSDPSAYLVPTLLPGDFDLMIYLQTSTAAQLLPFRY